MHFRFSFARSLSILDVPICALMIQKEDFLLIPAACATTVLLFECNSCRQERYSHTETTETRVLAIRPNRTMSTCWEASEKFSPVF